MTQKNEIHQYTKEEGGCNTDAHIDLGILHTEPHSVVTGVSGVSDNLRKKSKFR